MCSQRAQQAHPTWRLLAVAAAFVAAALFPAAAQAEEPGVVPEISPVEIAPEPAPEPVSSAVEDPEGGIVSSTMRSLPDLFVTWAQVRRGRLTLFATVARGVTGEIQGRANFGRGTRRFSAPIDSRGVISIDTRLRGGRRASAVRVTLIYRATSTFMGQRVTIRAARKSAQLRVLDVVADSQ